MLERLVAPQVPVLAAAVLGLLALTPARGADTNGWVTLFDGSSLKGWTNPSGQKPSNGWLLQDGAMVCQMKAGDIWTRERYGDFVLALEFRTQGNSGVFIRTDNPRDNVQTGIEIQVDRPHAPGKHSVGAVYDLQAPSKNAGIDGWNKMNVTAKGSLLKVELNGEQIIDLDLDRWAQPGLNPDGTKNKFKKALKDFKREGHIGFQDHGAEVAYRNVRIKPL